MAILNKEEQKMTRQNEVHSNMMHRSHAQAVSCDSFTALMAMAVSLGLVHLFGMILPIIIRIIQQP